MNILGLGLPELVVIALILLLFFGPKRLPGLFRSIGSSVKELKDGLKTGEHENSEPEHTTQAPTVDNSTGANNNESNSKT